MRIAVLCDVEVSRTLFARLARDAGHEVVEFGGSSEGDDTLAPMRLAALRATAPTAIVLDGRLGDPHGRRVEGAERCAVHVARLRADFGQIGIGVIAALGETALVAAAARAGADVVVPRPLLRTGVRAALESLAALHARGRSDSRE